MHDSRSLIRHYRGRIPESLFPTIQAAVRIEVLGDKLMEQHDAVARVAQIPRLEEFTKHFPGSRQVGVQLGRLLSEAAAGQSELTC